MEKKIVNLKKANVEIYNFGEITLYAYKTNDLMNDVSYILENSNNLFSSIL